MLFTADFETTTDPNDCRVWAWGVYQIGDTDYFDYGNSIDTFFDYLQKQENSTYYFQNLKFDSDWIFVWLFEHGYKHVTKREEEASKTFTTLISDKGQFYSIKIIFEKKNKKTKYVKIYDSLKIIPFSVEVTAKSFGLPFTKGELDYHKYRPIGHIITPEELDYLKRDVKIMAYALKTLFDQGLTKMTQGANALHDYKKIVGETNFKNWFPVPDYDRDVRQAFKGGFTYLNPLYKNRDIGEGIVLDVNSLYPWVLRDCPLPYGDGIFFKGKYKPHRIYKLYVQMLTCQFELKPGFIPTIQLKNNLSFIPTEYLTDSGDEEVTLCLTSVDLELFFEHYDVMNVRYHSGWMFKSTTGLFTEYIDKWSKVKIESKLNKNKGLYTLSKLMLNSLYGKFSTSPFVCSKYPYYDQGVIKFRQGEQETKEPLYIPVGAFVTAWARHKTITSAQKVYKYFAYADTDSLHLDLPLPPELSKMSNDDLEMLTTADLQKYGVPLPDDFIIDPVSLGAWKIESRFTRARFLRQKSYIEDWNTPETWGTELYDKSLLNITCAGMPKECYQYVTWENFHEGATYKGKKQPKHVKGGTVLLDVDFTIKRSILTIDKQ